MGYTTWFDGSFELDRPLTPEHLEYLNDFAATRRMKRDEFKTVNNPDPVREAVGLPVGEDGCYYVGGKESSDVKDYNKPPKGQPGLWCQWIPTEDGTAITWDEGEKFCNYIEWLEYVIDHFISPWGYKMNGSVSWSGEEDDDSGVITVSGNEVTIVKDVLIPETDLADEGAKLVLEEIGGDLMEVIYYSLGNESEDFLDNINEYHFRSEDQDLIDEGIDEIHDAIVNEHKSPSEILELIDDHIPGCGHIYIRLLRLLAWVNRTSTEQEA